MWCKSSFNRLSIWLSIGNVESQNTKMILQQTLYLLFIFSKYYSNFSQRKSYCSSSLTYLALSLFFFFSFLFFTDRLSPLFFFPSLFSSFLSSLLCWTSRQLLLASSPNSLLNSPSHLHFHLPLKKTHLHKPISWPFHQNPTGTHCFSVLGLGFLRQSRSRLGVFAPISA